jgi:hypothetical protein
MIWNRWRPRLIYLMMSAFVAWHALALVIAPAPRESVLVQTQRAFLQPYLTFFRLDNPWNFFAPTIRGAELRYAVEDAAGARTEFAAVEQTNWFHPEYIWLRDFNYTMMDDPEIYADRVGELLCRKHASLHPVSITFVERDHSDFKPEDWLDGKRPQDPEFIRDNTLRTVQCSAS